jgi:hypothetical protein
MFDVDLFESLESEIFKKIDKMSGPELVMAYESHSLWV